jgi:hypothetical protein
MSCNIPIQINGQPAWGCSTPEEASRADYLRHKTWRDSVTGSVVEFARGVGDTAESLFYFPEDTLKYITGTDSHYGQRNSWSNIGNTLTWSDNPAMRTVITVNSMVYGGFDLLLGHIPYTIVNDKLSINMPYFNPPPQTARELGSDLSMVATILATPALKARAYKAFGVVAQPKPVTQINDYNPQPKLDWSPAPMPLNIALSAMPLLDGIKRMGGAFFDFYQKSDAEHKYVTGVTTAAAAYVGGDVLAQLVLSSKQPFDFASIITLTGLSFYYGWEIPLILSKIDSTIPIKNIDIGPRLKGIANLAREIANDGGCAARGDAIVGEVKQILKDKRGEILRPLTFMVGVSPFWTMRHMAILNLMHGIHSPSLTIVAGALATWASTTPVIFGIEYVIQNKIPLKYRFLAQSAVVTTWHTIASLVTLLE